MIIRRTSYIFFLLIFHAASLYCMDEASRPNIHLDTAECKSQNIAATVLQKRSYLEYVSHEIDPLEARCIGPMNDHPQKKSRQASSTEVKLIAEEYKDGEKFEALRKLFTQNPLIIPTTPKISDYKSRFKIPAWLMTEEEKANKEQQKAITCQNANTRTFLYTYFSKIFHNDICDNHAYIRIMQLIVCYAKLKP